MADIDHGIARRGLMLVISSPSGAGKTSLARALLENDKLITMSVSATTRKPRPSETHGVDYHFFSDDQFSQHIDDGSFLEWATVFNNRYGTLRKAVEDRLDNGGDVLFDIDWQGTQQLHEKCQNDVVRVFILPPSAKVLENRLISRAEDKVDIVKKRMAEASGQISHWAEYDYVIINQDFEHALEELTTVLHAERLRRERRVGLSEFVRSMQGDL